MGEKMSQIEDRESDCELKLYELINKAVSEAIDIVNDELVDFYEFKLYSVFTKVENYDLSIEINMSYSTRLMEISWSVGGVFSDYISRIEEEEGRELTEEEVEELWNERYENKLEELNAEYIYPIEGKIEYDLSGVYPFYSGGLEVNISPLPCDGDYCDVGAEINIKFKAIRVETIESVSHDFTRFLTELLRLIYNILNL